MENGETLGQAVSKFESKFKKFLAAGEKEIKPPLSKSTGEYISVPDKDNRFRQSVIDEYKKFLTPYQVFGKNSAIADQLEKDKENLVALYNFHLALQELNNQYSANGIYIKEPYIETPLLKRERYTRAGQFIYLQSWFIYEHKDFTLVPELEQNSSTGKWTISFNQEKLLHITGNDMEIRSIIQECFYPDKEY